MKKYLFVFATLFSLHLFAQKVSIKAGLAMSGYSVEGKQAANFLAPRSNISTELKPGLVLGGLVDFGLNENLFIRSGAEMVVKGGIEKGIYTDIYGGFIYPYRNSINFVAFDFPLHLLYKTGLQGQHRWIFGGGFVPGILIEGGLNKGDLGGGLLVGYEFPGGLNYHISYNHGLVNVASNSFDYKTLKNRSLAVSVSYNFRQKTAVEQARLEAAAKEPVNVQELVKVLFAEIGSPGGFLSFNFDTRFDKSHKGLGVRAGVGALFDLGGSGYSIPVALNYLLGEKTHFFEPSAGATYFHIEQSSSDSWFDFQNEKFLAPFVSVGYRYQPLYKKFVFRANVAHFIGVRMPGILRAPSFSLGYRL